MAAVVAFDGPAAAAGAAVRLQPREGPRPHAGAARNVVDMEESAAAEAEAMMEAQAQAAALIDTLQGDMHTCGRCQEIVLEVNMAPATSGEFRNSWLCRNEEACIARATAGGRGARVRRKRKEFE